MAISLITVTGTSGTVLVKYKESAVSKKMILEPGTHYMNDAIVTDLTSTTLTGDAEATSGVFTITDVPLVCYHFKWDFSPIENYEFVAIEVDGVEIPLVNSTFPSLNPDVVAEAINSLGDDTLKAVQAKIDNVARPNFILVVKAVATEPPRIKVSNTADSASFFIEGEAGACSTAGFYDYNTCQPIILP